METIQKIKIEVPESTYQTIKKSILNDNQFVRVDIDSKEIKLKNSRVAIIEGRDVELSRKALQELTKIFGVSKTFYDLMSRSFDNDTELVNLLFSTIQGRKSTKITFVFNLQLNRIVKVYQTGTKLISDSQYFDTVEKVIKNSKGSYLRNIAVLENGDITATIVNPTMEFQIGTMSDEMFTMGTTLDFINNELTSSFFTERLVCSNGARITDKLCTRSVKVGKEVPEFMEALTSDEFQIHSVEEFKKRVNRLYHTTASLQEVLSIESRLSSLFNKKNEEELLMSRFDARHLKHAFGPEYMMRTDIHKYLKTNITMWDLTNQVTGLSSYIEQNGLFVEPRVNTQLQIIGGSILFSNPNLPPSNIRQVF
jgi:hypothetical protein